MPWSQAFSPYMVIYIYICSVFITAFLLLFFLTLDFIKDSRLKIKVTQGVWLSQQNNAMTAQDSGPAFSKAWLQARHFLLLPWPPILPGWVRLRNRGSAGGDALPEAALHELKTFGLLSAWDWVHLTTWCNHISAAGRGCNAAPFPARAGWHLTTSPEAARHSCSTCWCCGQAFLQLQAQQACHQLHQLNPVLLCNSAEC